MANYISALTGAAMDDALQQMNNRVPEGWAVGERDGVPVGEESLYYHNNAKYYAEYAQGQAERAESAVPAGTAGAVFFDRVQTLTDAQAMQARANIKAGGSNRNLLDNPWFTVNQRGFASSTGANNVSIVDRWYINNGTGGTVTANADGSITIDANSGSGYVSFEQRIPFDLTGKTVTVSVIFADGTVLSATGTAPARTTAYQLFVRGLAPSLEIRATAVPASITAYGVTTQIVVYQGGSVTIKAWKLELGSVSTLANDAPPNYAEELAKCQRYFIRLAGSYAPVGFGAIVSTTIATCMIPLPVPMRAAPTVTLTGTLYTNGRAAIAVQSFTTAPPSGNAIGINITSTSLLTIGEAVLLQFRDANSHLDLSADL